MVGVLDNNPIYITWLEYLIITTKNPTAFFVYNNTMKTTFHFNFDFN